MIKILTALGAAALAASALCTPAAASPVDQTKVVVSYKGLDLANPADAARLERRLREAARAVCSDAPILDLSLAGEIEACRAEVMSRARADMQVAIRSGGGRVLALRTN
jgi:UrcA family protein